MTHPDIRASTLNKMRAQVAEHIANGDNNAARRAQKHVRMLAKRVTDAYASAPHGIITHISGAPSTSRYLA